MNRQGTLLRILGVTAVLALAAGAPLALASTYWTSVLTTMAINCLMVASLRVVFLVGEMSLGHVGFMCIGAYASALLTLKAGLPFAVTLPAAGLMAGVVALIIGFPFMRVRMVYFVFLTAMASESIRLLASNWRLTGGSNGLIGFPGPGVLSVAGVALVDFSGFTAYYYLTLSVVCASLLILYRIENSRLGFTWLAIRDAAKMAGSVGINVLKYKVIAFCIACFFAGIGGALFADAERALSAREASAFGVMTTIYLLIYMVVGGKSRFFGPMVGVVVLGLISELIRVQEYQPMVIGASAITVVLSMPEGLVSVPRLIARWFTRPPAITDRLTRGPGG